MPLSLYFKLYGVAVCAFFAIDLVWLGIVARNFYQRHLGSLLRPQPNWTAAIIFYLLFILGMVVFSVVPALRDDSLKKAVLLGGFFGLITYATYDLTNLATLRDWPLVVVLVDIGWGIVLAGSVTTITFLAGRWFSSS